MLESLEQPKREKRGKARVRGNGRGTLFKLPDGRYRYQYRKDGIMRASAITANKTEAEKALSKAIADYERGVHVGMNRTTVREFSKTWLGRHKGKAQSTLDKYERELNLILEHIGGMKLRDVNAGHIKDALAKIADRKGTKGLGRNRVTSSSTLAGVRTRIRAVVREAVSEGIIPNDVTISVKRIKKLKTEHPGIALDFDQAARFHELGEALYDANECCLWTALFLCVSVGLRKGEVMALRWKDVKFESSELLIRRNYTKSSKGYEMKESTKTDAGTRDIPFAPSVKAALERQRTKMEAQYASVGLKLLPTSPMFATINGEYTHPDNLNRALNAIIRWSNPEPVKQRGKDNKKMVTLEQRLRAVAVEHRPRLQAVVLSGAVLPSISPHDLRHTAGSLMLMRGMSLETVSEILGHQDSSITRKVYIHLTKTFKRDNLIDLFPVVPSRVTQAIAMN
jgi:integrase